MLIASYKGNPAFAARGNFLEIGANIGACTLEMLHLTDARVVALEPSATSAVGTGPRP